jgi:hypothetical protein
MSNFTINPNRFQWLVAPLLTILDAAIDGHKSDWHCRKFSARTHLLLSLYAQLSHAPSANALLEELNDTGLAPQSARNLRQMLAFDGLDPHTLQPITLNQSSFSRANAHRSWRLWRYCFHQLWSVAARHCQLKQLAGLGDIVALDGSFLDCLPRMTWALYRKDSPKLKGHFFFNANGLPEKMVLTTGKGSERDVLRQHLRKGSTYVFDRGYNSYDLFDHLSQAACYFVTRLLANASIQIICSSTLDAEQHQQGIVGDHTIRFKNDASARLYRLVEYRTASGEVRQYVTSRTDLTSQQIVELYEWRWQIELFFGWIKTHLQLRHWYSENENGILIQLYAALISFLLLKLFAQTCGEREMRQMTVTMVRWVQRHLFDPLSPDQLQAYLSLIGLELRPDSS